MKIDFSQQMCDIDGTPISNDKDDGAATLGLISVNALLAAFADEQALPGTDKVRRYELARKVRKGGVVEVTAEDAALIKQLIGKAYAPLVVGQAWGMLDG